MFCAWCWLSTLGMIGSAHLPLGLSAVGLHSFHELLPVLLVRQDQKTLFRVGGVVILAWMSNTYMSGEADIIFPRYSWYLALPVL